MYRYMGLNRLGNQMDDDMAAGIVEGLCRNYLTNETVRDLGGLLAEQFMSSFASKIRVQALFQLRKCKLISMYSIAGP